MNISTRFGFLISLILLSTFGLQTTSFIRLFSTDVFAGSVSLRSASLERQASDGPNEMNTVDLTANIELFPASPEPGEEVTIRVVVENIGSTSMERGANFFVRLFVDPSVDPTAQPPIDESEQIFFWSQPGLRAGGSTTLERSYTFQEEGCEHVIYAWVDPENAVGDDASNNLVSLPVCIGVECEVDVYEVDDTCQVARWVSDGFIGESHTLCKEREGEQLDADWIKFTAFMGLTYTLALDNLGTHADPQVSIYEQCNGAALPVVTAQIGMTKTVQWQPLFGGITYAKVENHPETQGPATQYDLHLNSTSGVTDAYEPDNGCTTARDIPTDGTRQSHLFQAPNDEDWIKFSIRAGESFAIAADNTGPNVNPVVALYNSCDQALSDASGARAFQGIHQARLGRQAEPLEAHTTTDQVYYAQITHPNPDVFGEEAYYDIYVVASDCIGDEFEPDNTREQASVLALSNSDGQDVADNAIQTRNVCPVADADWVQFEVEAAQIYVLQTETLGVDADTVLELYDSAGQLIARNDDYGYLKASRIVFEPNFPGTHYARVQHINIGASGPDTAYTISLQEGSCSPDIHEGDSGDNGPGDAIEINPNGPSRNYNFCADPLRTDVGDQDWFRFEAVVGGNYTIRTSGLAGNSDTILRLYDQDGETVIMSNDDIGVGRAAAFQFTPQTTGTYYVQTTQYNANVTGAQTNYRVSVDEDIPPTPTPSPTPSPTPVPVPTTPPTPQPSEIRTLIVTNRERLQAIHGVEQTDALMEKLFELADDDEVQGALVLVERDPSTAVAYDNWVVNNESLFDTDLTNAVASAIRNRLMSLLESSPNLEYVTIIGDDRIVPFRRVLELDVSQQEEEYASDVTANTTIAAALAANMILTDDYYVDVEPDEWDGNDLFLPDYGIGRLLETPEEIIGVIDQFLAGSVIETENVLVSGYDFVQDSAEIMGTLFENDVLTTDDDLIDDFWLGDDLRDRHLNASPRFDIHALNGHATHIANGTPDNRDITATEVANSITDLAGALIFNVGCHGGLNDPGLLDLPQAFAQKRVIYVGNTGFGWGGGGIIYSESVMRNFVRELVRDTQAEVGPALQKAKQKYYSRSRFFDGYDAKVLMQLTLYGLPMVSVTSGGTLSDDDPFPSADSSFSPPTAFSDGISTGTFSFSAAGAFGENQDSNTAESGTFLDFDENVEFSAGAPVQPRYYANAAAPSAGELRGVLFLGGVYSDVVNFDPAIGLAYNEYVEDTAEANFADTAEANGWYPRLPFAARVHQPLSSDAGSREENVIMTLGQFDATSGTERVYDAMTLNTFYSNSTDQIPPEIAFIDGILHETQEGNTEGSTATTGEVKLETTDDLGIQQVVVAFTEGDGTWRSQDLDFNESAQKWTGTFTATLNTRYFVQVVDNAGNVTADDNKGRYYALLKPLPLVEGRGLTESELEEQRVFLPVVSR
ncbi:MAG: pre-peptidase C-terminal domain-containing protein [Chloroflexota bacterium]